MNPVLERNIVKLNVTLGLKGSDKECTLFLTTGIPYSVYHDSM